MRNRLYFVVGNSWLLMALVLWLGRNAVRYAPTRYSFFGVGGSLSPFAYGFLILACAVIGVVLIVLAHRSTDVSGTR
jgi:hypothetical protein